MLIFIAAVVLAAAVGILVYILTGMTKSKKKNRNQNIAISGGGTAVNNAATGSLGGGLLFGGESDCVTHLVGASKILRAQGIVEIELKHRDTGEIYEAVMKDYLEIGRDQGSKTAGAEYLQVNYRWISRLHCSIVRRKDLFYIRDMGSANHTYLNGQMVNGETLIRDGDMVRLADETFLIRIVE